MTSRPPRDPAGFWINPSPSVIFVVYRQVVCFLWRFAGGSTVHCSIPLWMSHVVGAFPPCLDGDWHYFDLSANQKCLETPQISPERPQRFLWWAAPWDATFTWTYQMDRFGPSLVESILKGQRSGSWFVLVLYWPSKVPHATPKACNHLEGLLHSRKSTKHVRKNQNSPIPEQSQIHPKKV